ncbi:MAG TPA: hypothetical protein VGG66_11465, partial [Rhizomicrobium sp.]
MNRSFLAACAVALFAIATPAASAADILVHDSKSQPESLARSSDGTLIVGSASSPFVYRVRPGSAAAETFIDASADGPGTFFFGQLVDVGTNTVWSCELTPVPGVTPVARHTALIGSDLKTGKQKLRWNLPGNNSTCND